MDTMGSNDKRDMAALALELVGEFSKLQDTTDQLIRMYAKKRAPALAAFLDEENLNERVSDKQRPRLVTGIAAELETAADVSKFSNVFHRVKEIRDFVAHGTYTQRIDDDNIVIWNNYVSGPDIKKKGIKKRDSLSISRDQLTSRLKDARWLIQHVHFITGSSELTQQLYLGEHPVAFAEPTADPLDWNGQMFKP